MTSALKMLIFPYILKEKDKRYELRNIDGVWKQEKGKKRRLKNKRL